MKVVLEPNEVTNWPLESIVYDRVVESVYLSGPQGQGCNEPVAVTMALSYKYEEGATVQQGTTREH